jgi:hypothetical protein
MRKILEQCPGCGGALEVTQLSCPECETVISGHFTPTRFCRLSPENLKFAESFIRLRGNIKEMERELGVSYPTVRSRLTEVIRALGFEPAEEPREEEESAGERREILTKLETGQVSAQEAVELLRKAKR